MIRNQAAYDVGRLARDLAAGYGAHSAAIIIAGKLDRQTIHRVTEPDPVGVHPCKDGNDLCYNVRDFLRLAREPKIAAELPRVWLASALLAVGDASAENDYFDRAPELEFVRHLRNGIAHGNRFDIRDPERLKRFPAHNRDVRPKRPDSGTFEITPTLDGQRVLFDFMEAGDVVELLFAVSLYLSRMSAGESPRQRIRESLRDHRHTVRWFRRKPMS
jgi:hypothetical protein